MTNKKEPKEVRSESEQDHGLILDFVQPKEEKTKLEKELERQHSTIRAMRRRITQQRGIIHWLGVIVGVQVIMTVVCLLWM